MILVCDVGNTETTLGIYDGETLRAHWRIMTDVPRTADEFGLLLRQLLIDEGINPTHISGAGIASVVPRITAPLTAACRTWLTDNAVYLVDGRSDLPIELDVDEPLTVGADRIVNTLAASRLYQRDAIVVDLGTATTFDCITAQGVFLGGVIAPGVLMMAESLSRKTSKLPATELRLPKQIIGRRTEECIRAGVMYGAAEQIDGLVRRIKAEWPRKNAPLVIATGGLAETFKPLCRELAEVDPFLTLRGLQIAYTLLVQPKSFGNK